MERLRTVRRVVVPEGDIGGSWYRRILAGIANYASAVPDWEVQVVRRNRQDFDAVREWQPDGVIAIIGRHEPLKPWLSLGCPVVSVATMLADAPIASVSSDDEAAGRQAAAHLIERGLRHFGFVGQEGHAAAELRAKGFSEAVAEARGSYQSLFHPTPLAETPAQDALRFETELLEWLDALPKPVGVMGWQDRDSIYIVQSCRRLGLRVPDQVAVVGVDDDEIWCNLCIPPLSSVRLPSRRIGYQGAALLDRLMSEPELQMDPPTVRLPPEGVHVRKSSDTVAVDDPLIIEAVAFVRSNLHRRVNVADMVSTLAVSRRALETRFKNILGRSPQQEIHRQQMDAAENLLRMTDLPLKAVAMRSGYRDANHLIRVFAKTKGISPNTFRKQNRVV
jgi:LacI family transcriptional regulator